MLITCVHFESGQFFFFTVALFSWCWFVGFAFLTFCLKRVLWPLMMLQFLHSLIPIKYAGGGSLQGLNRNTIHLIKKKQSLCIINYKNPSI